MELSKKVGYGYLKNHILQETFESISQESLRLEKNIFRVHQSLL